MITPTVVALVLGFAVVLGLAVVPAGQAAEPDDRILVTRVDGPITPIVADHLVESVRKAERDGHGALVIEIDTPGGLDSAMRDIVQAFLGARVPVVVYVSPAGARAASAGALIAWSAHVVAMAPGTTIGAATPVNLEGGEVGDKIVNDAAAYARAIARQRNRNVEAAAEAVTEGRAVSATEAVDIDAADLIADDRAALLTELNGREVVLPGGQSVTLATANPVIEKEELSPLRRFLQLLANPNLAFLFMSLGTLGIIYELATPGVGAAGGVGVLLILLALFSLAVLPIDAVGLLFLLAAGVLFGVELFAPGIGVAAALGTVALALSGAFLFRESAPGLAVSPAVVVPTVVAVGSAVIVAGRLALRARGTPTSTGPQALVGRQTVVIRSSGTSGQAMVEGVWWNVRAEAPLRPGQPVRVRAVDGLDLLVEPASPSNEPLGSIRAGPDREEPQ